MIVKTLLATSLVLAAGLASAQTVDPQTAARSTKIVEDMRRLELMNQILPLALEKNQIKELLPAIEKVRDNVRKLMKTEADELVRYEGPSAKAVSDAIKGKMPAPDYVKELVAFQKAADVRRQIALNENVEVVHPIFKRVLNPGQYKVAANSLTVSFFQPDLAPDKATDEQKVRIFIREVMLDPLTYDLLIQIYKQANS